MYSQKEENIAYVFHVAADMQGIGEKRANFILELREESPEPFKNVSILY